MAAPAEHGADAPFYLPIRDEIEIFEQAYACRLPVLLKGPTGCGKTRFVEYMAQRLLPRASAATRPSLITVACHEDLTGSDLVGRYLIQGDDTVWIDGPLTQAVRTGAICYLDEVVEARHDSLAILHSLTDHRRTLFLDRQGEAVRAPDTFMLVCSYNPAYRSTLKDLKPSFRQRFVTVALDYLPAEREVDVLVAETGITSDAAARLVRCASSIRNADAAFHLEPPSTRTLVTAAHLVAAGMSEAEAAEACVLGPLSTDGAVTDALREIAAATLLPAPRTSPHP
jgi:nitric oxide reductase NorQ protein